VAAGFFIVFILKTEQPAYACANCILSRRASIILCCSQMSDCMQICLHNFHQIYEIYFFMKREVTNSNFHQLRQLECRQHAQHERTPRLHKYIKLTTFLLFARCTRAHLGFEQWAVVYFKAPAHAFINVTTDFLVWGSKWKQWKYKGIKIPLYVPLIKFLKPHENPLLFFGGLYNF